MSHPYENQELALAGAVHQETGQVSEIKISFSSDGRPRHAPKELAGEVAIQVAQRAIGEHVARISFIQAWLMTVAQQANAAQGNGSKIAIAKAMPQGDARRVLGIASGEQFRGPKR